MFLRGMGFKMERLENKNNRCYGEWDIYHNKFGHTMLMVGTGHPLWQ